MSDSRTGAEEPGAGDPAVDMRASVRDQGTSHQAGRNQYVNYHYYGGAPASRNPAPEPAAPPGPTASPGANAPGDPGRNGTAERGWFRAHRKEWIGFAGMVVAAAIGAAVTYAVAPDDKGGGEGGGSAASEQTPGGVSSSLPKAGDTPGAPATGAGPVASATARANPSRGVPPIRWQGPLVLEGYGKDLDAEQPAGNSGKNDLNTQGAALDYDLVTFGDAIVSLWTGGEPPDYDDCAATVGAAGRHSQPLEEDSVFCFRTDEGRVGRAEVVDMPEDELAPVVAFDAVVWDSPS
ncbi:hypothetical protein ACG5V6_14000 [Streptomyces chitinivorans]|uniref:Serine/threonine protein kinase n=1 Tax=Streptomyces chitinivorans TaxID=1257027 RepID=A0ABW7HTX6_9ACTN|nr:hypothetical protein [Streptomyces chitinivorans]MDH2409795.1 hypothetical protein [Streptomyces chitinivorans]